MGTGNFDKKRFRRYISTIILGLVLVLLHIWSRGITELPMLSDKIKMLSDAFFLPSVLIFGFGILIWIASAGQFDVFSFGFKQFWDVMFNRKKKDRQAKDFVEYRQEGLNKAKERDENEGRPYIPMIIIGLAFFAISFIFNIIFETMI